MRSISLRNLLVLYRFWEGRKIWEQLLTQSRDIARMAALYSEVLGRKAVMRHAQLLCVFPHILQEHLQVHTAVCYILLD
jgi:predicted membrane chloride channel (bestrophin family)